MTGPTTHQLRINARGIAYGGSDLYVTCTHPECTEFRVEFDTNAPLVADIVEAQNWHIRNCAAEWAGGDVA